MCGIVCTFNLKQPVEMLRSQVLDMSKKLRHRGPDWSGIYSSDNAILAHERLAIVDPASGRQPLYSSDKNYILAVNGEIYNHIQLREMLKSEYQYLTYSDCEVIIPLSKTKGHQFRDESIGIFDFAIFNESTGE
ncbi:MAG TPA: asparagine synthase B, partial [Saprospiraceae bacterium]|nr:asparagine synthase B [Saprospiraceae bacterium]